MAKDVKNNVVLRESAKNLTDRLLPPDKAQLLDGEFQQEVAPGIIRIQVCTTCNVSHIFTILGSPATMSLDDTLTKLKGVTHNNL